MAKLKDRVFVVMDLETTGFSGGRDDVVEIGFVEFVSGRKARSFSSLVSIGKPVNAAAMKVNGITDEMLEGQPTLADLAAEVCLWLEKSTLVGFNIVGFDLPFLKAALGRIGIIMPEPAEVIDVLVTARKAFPGQDNRQGSVAMRLGVELDGDDHRAECDAEVCGLVALAMENLGVEDALATVRGGRGDDDAVMMARRTVMSFMGNIGAAKQFALDMTVNNDDDCNKCVRAIGRLRELQKNADKLRLAQVKPLKDKTGEIDALYREHIKKPIAEAQSRLESAMVPYQTEKRRLLEAEAAAKVEVERQRLRAEAEAEEARIAGLRKELEEAEAKLARAKTDHSKASWADVVKGLREQLGLATDRAYESAGADARQLDKLHEEALDPKTKLADVSTSGKWVYELKVVDHAALPRQYLMPDMAALNRDAEGAYAEKDGTVISAIPGTSIERTWKTTVRTR